MSFFLLVSFQVNFFVLSTWLAKPTKKHTTAFYMCCVPRMEKKLAPSRSDELYLQGIWTNKIQFCCLPYYVLQASCSTANCRCVRFFFSPVVALMLHVSANMIFLLFDASQKRTAYFETPNWKYHELTVVKVAVRRKSRESFRYVQVDFSCELLWLRACISFVRRKMEKILNVRKLLTTSAKSFSEHFNSCWRIQIENQNNRHSTSAWLQNFDMDAWALNLACVHIDSIFLSIPFFCDAIIMMVIVLVDHFIVIEPWNWVKCQMRGEKNSINNRRDPINMWNHLTKVILSVCEIQYRLQHFKLSYMNSICLFVRWLNSNESSCNSFWFEPFFHFYFTFFVGRCGYIMRPIMIIYLLLAI